MPYQNLKTKLTDTMFSIESIYLASIIHGVVLCTLLLTRQRGDRSANRYLALLIGLLTLSLWNLYSYKQGLPGYWRLIDYNAWYSPLFWGPAIYLYTVSLVSEQPISMATILRHFSVGILFFISANLLSLLDAMASVSPNYLDIYRIIHLFTFYIQISIYIYACFLVTKTYNERLQNQYSTTEHINLVWLQRLILIFAVLIAIDMVITVPSILRNIWPIPFLDYYLLAEAIAIYLVGYLYLQRTAHLPTNRRPKYDSSPLDDKNSQELLGNLNKVMKELKPYQNPGLKLSELAELVDTHPHYLSQLINERLSKNFYDYVNSHRAELAAKMIRQKKGDTITNIAYEAGFNNRVSFNKTFKKHTGMTPSKYRRNQTATDTSVQEPS